MRKKDCKPGADFVSPAVLSLLVCSVWASAHAESTGDEVSSSSHADEPAVANESHASGARNRVIEEIVVTAQKREENLQDVPISVQAFSGDALDAKGFQDARDLQQMTPGLTYNQVVGYTVVYLRGIGSDAFIPSADMSVATYVDNVYYPFSSALASALGEVERIEVLKGPQGTLFGRNSTGGAINIVTRQPGKTFETSVTTTVGSYDKVNARVYTNIPLTDTFAFSISGLSFVEDNYYKLTDASSRKSFPPETSQAFSAKTAWTPVDDLNIVLSYTYTHTQGARSVMLPAYYAQPLGYALGIRETKEKYYTDENVPSYIDAKSRVASGDIKYSFDAFDVRLIGAEQRSRVPAMVDFDASHLPLLQMEAKGQFAKTTTGEFQILSNAQSWGADWLKWLGGVFYIDSQAGFDPLLFTVGPGVLDYLASPPPDGPLGALAGTTAPLLTAIRALLICAVT